MKTILETLFAIVVVSAFMWIKNRYRFGFYYINRIQEAKAMLEEALRPKTVYDLKPENYDHAIDLRGTPTHICPCGCNIWNVKVIFEDFEVATYFLDIECANCGSMATAPTLLDREKME